MIADARIRKSRTASPARQQCHWGWPFSEYFLQGWACYRAADKAKETPSKKSTYFYHNDSSIWKWTGLLFVKKKKIILAPPFQIYCSRRRLDRTSVKRRQHGCGFTLRLLTWIGSKHGNGNMVSRSSCSKTSENRSSRVPRTLRDIQRSRKRIKNMCDTLWKFGVECGVELLRY